MAHGRRVKTKKTSKLADYMTTEEYKYRDTLLDCSNLELEKNWTIQPRLMHEFAVRLAMARAKYDRAKSALNVAKADADKSYRKYPAKYGFKTKPTEAALLTYIPTHPKYLKAYDKFVEAKYLVGLFEGMVEAINQRKSTMENLVRLHGMDYFGKPKTDGQGNAFLAERKKKAVRKKKNR